MSNAATALRMMPEGANATNRVTGLSGNEIYCANALNFRPGNISIGNCVYSLGVMRKVTSGLRNLSGGEIPEITKLIHDGREQAFERMCQEAKSHGATGITGTSSELVNHGGNIEFLSIGSGLHRAEGDRGLEFTTSATGQELYCQVDSGFQPVQFVFGNVAYSIGVGGNIGGMFRGMKRGEVPQFSEIYNQTRHLALQRISDQAKKCGANSVIGIETTITPFMGTQEMLMLGTASRHPALSSYADNPITSDLTNEELWNLVNLGFLPVRLVMGVSVYSLGIAGGVKAMFQSLGRGEIETVTKLVYEARESALARVQKEAQQWGADEVVGVKTHFYDLGGGLIEFLAIGTAVKKFNGVTTKNSTLPAQAIIRDRDTYFDSQLPDGVGPGAASAVDLSAGNAGSARLTQKGPMAILFGFFAVLIALAEIVLKIASHN